MRLVQRVVGNDRRVPLQPTGQIFPERQGLFLIVLVLPQPAVAAALIMLPPARVRQTQQGQNYVDVCRGGFVQDMPELRKIALVDAVVRVGVTD